MIRESKSVTQYANQLRRPRPSPYNSDELRPQFFDIIRDAAQRMVDLMPEDYREDPEYVRIICYFAMTQIDREIGFLLTKISRIRDRGETLNDAPTVRDDGSGS